MPRHPPPGTIFSWSLPWPSHCHPPDSGGGGLCQGVGRPLLLPRLAFRLPLLALFLPRLIPLLPPLCSVQEKRGSCTCRRRWSQKKHPTKGKFCDQTGSKMYETPVRLFGG